MDFFRSVVAAAALTGIAAALAPAKDGIRRAVMTALSVLFIFTVAVSATNSDPSGLFPELSFDIPESDIPLCTFEEGVEMGIKEDLRRAFSLSDAEVEVEATIAAVENTVTVNHLTVILYGGALRTDTLALVRYVANTYSAECEVRFVGHQKMAG